MPVSLSGSLLITGSLTVTEGIIMSGSIASASFATNSSLLNGTGSGDFTSVNSFNSYTSSTDTKIASINTTTGSQNTRLSALETASGSAITRLGALEVASGSAITRLSGLEIASGSAITRLSALETASGSAITRLSSLETASGSAITRLSSLENRTGSYATTGSNNFNGTQTITGSLLQSGNYTTTGTITAQTINVQQVTSSIVYSSGSNIFGNAIGNTQTFTGSVNITGSLSLNNITIPTSASLASTYLPLAGGTLTGALSGTSATFSSNIIFSNTNTSINYGSSRFFLYNGTNTYIGDIDALSATASTILRTNGVDRLTILATGVATFSGSVGIGTTSPANAFNVSNNGASGFEVSPTGGVNSGVLLQAYNRSTSAYMAQSYYACTHTFNVGGGGGTRALDITSTGNVGVGTSSPDVFSRSYSGRILGVSSAGQSAIGVNSAAGNGAYIDMGINGTRYLGLYTDSVSSDISTIGAYPLTLSINSTPRLLFSSTGIACFACQVCAPVAIFSGCVGIGTTNPGVILDVKFDSSSTDITGSGASSLRLLNTCAANTNNFHTGIWFRLDNGINNKNGYIKLVNDATNATGDFTFTLTQSGTESERVRIKGNGNVGIGTTNPSYKLDICTAQSIRVIGSSTGYTQGSIIFQSSTTDTPEARGLGVYAFNEGTDATWFYGTAYNAADSFVVNRKSGTTYQDAAASVGEACNFLLINNTGRVGIGVTPSAWASSFKALQVGTATLSQNNTQTAYVGSNWASESGGDKYLTTAPAAIYAQNSGAHIWYQAPSGTAGCTISFTQAMTLDASGNLMLGVTSSTGYWPANLTQSSAKQIIQYNDSTTNLNNANAGLVILNSNTTAGTSSKLVFGAYNTDPVAVGLAYISAVNSSRSSGYLTGDLVFGTSRGGSTGAIEGMRITSGGAVGIGDAAPSSYGSGYANLWVGSSGKIGYLSVSNGSVNLELNADGNGVVRTRSNHALILGTNETERMRITATGIACFACQVCAPSATINGTFGLANGSFRTYGGTGDLTISVSNLPTLDGNIWRTANGFISYSGVQTDQATQTDLFAMFRLRGLSCWNEICVFNIVGSTTLNLSNGSTTCITLTLDVNNSVVGSALVSVSNSNSATLS